MNTKWKHRNWLAAGGALLLASSLAFAYAPPRRGFAAGRGGMGMEGGFAGHRFARALDLTDAQKSQMRQIREDTRTANQPYVEQLKALRGSEREAVKSGKSEAELQTLARDMAAVMANVHGNRLVEQSRMWKVLTPEQQKKAEDMGARMRERKSRRAGERPSGPPPQQ